MLKRHLKTSRGDFARCFVLIDELLNGHFKKVIASFQTSLKRIEVSSNISLFKLVRGVVSLNALRHMVKELQRSNERVGFSKELCGCEIRRVYLLPCACELGIKFRSGIPIKPDDIDPHWRHLNLDVFDEQPTQDSNTDCDITLELEGVLTRFNKLSLDEKFALKKALKELAWPSTTTMVPPLHKVKPKGAPPKKRQKKFFDEKREPSRWEHVDEQQRLTQEAGTSIIKSTQRSSGKKSSLPPPWKKSQPSSTKTQPSSKMSQASFRNISNELDTSVNLQFVPTWMHKSVVKITDVIGDGNCGFRAVGFGLNGNEHTWPVVRQDLIKETQKYEALYTPMFGEKRLLDIRKALTPEGHGPQEEDKWLDMPEMGYIIATKYNVALVQLSHSMNFLYLPLRGRKERSEYKLVTILNKNNWHWLNVTLSDTSPLPTVAPQWWSNHSPESYSWFDSYQGRILQWQSVCPPAPVRPPLPPTSYDAPICVDLADDGDGF